MKFLTFDNLLDKNIHTNTSNNLIKTGNHLYKVFKSSSLLNLTYTSLCLYKLYKIFYLLHFNNMYFTLICTSKLYNKKILNLFTKLTNNNSFINKRWVRGYITNSHLIDNLFLVYLWIIKFYYKNKTVIVPSFVLKLKNKIKTFCMNMKFKKFSKFIFICDLDKEKCLVNECISTNKFIVGICRPNCKFKFIDFIIYNNNINEVTLNFILKLITVASINGSY